MFVKTRKDTPKDEVSKNAQLLIQAGYIYKEMAGVYSYLPLGLRVVQKIENIIRKEMNAIGGEELLLTTFQDKILWELTGRWSDKVVDNWFKTKLKNGTEIGLGFTHEEPLTRIMKDHIRSFRDLPIYAYQIQNKFRNETRAKSGLIRGREFLMKDLYSFSRDEKEHLEFYKKCKEAYKNIFDKIGIGGITYFTFASGGSFSEYSHEFQTLTASGEDIIYICDKCKIAVNKEIIAKQKKCPECENKDLRKEVSVEVGNIFSLGTKFSDAFGLKYMNEKDEEMSVVMGSYGIGPGRLMGVATEVFADKDGIVWPKSISPFDLHLILLNGEDEKIKKYADLFYDKCVKKGIDVLYDDRNLRPGEKFADSDLLGISNRVIISKKTIEDKMFEVKERKSGEVRKMTEEELYELYK